MLGRSPCLEGMFAALSIAPQPQQAATMAGSFVMDQVKEDEEIAKLLQGEKVEPKSKAAHAVGWNPIEFKWDMDVMVMQADVPERKSCVDGNGTINMCGATRTCITCQAMANMKSMAATEQQKQAAEAVITHMQLNQVGYNNASGKEVMEALCNFFADNATTRKVLSHMGAVRVPRERALNVLTTTESLNNYFVWVLKHPEG